MQRYESYKSSSIPWIDELPKHWGEEKGKWLHRFRKDLNNRKQCDNVLSLTLRGVVNNDPDDPEGLVPKDYGTYQIFEKDDLVFKLIDLENFRTSRVGLVHERGIMSPAYLRVQPGKEHNPRYFYYYYFTLYQQGIYNKLGAGVRSTLGPTDLLEIGVPVPSKEEQDRIVTFLDQKTAEIDAAIAKKDRLIELLIEQKSILISEAVTKGLNPNATIVDTELEWLGEMPAHWKLEKVKSLFRLVIDPAPPNNDYELLSIYTDIGVRPRKDLEQKGNRASTTDGYWRVKEGDFIVNKLLAWMGAIGLSNYSGVTSPAYDILRPRSNLDGNYYHYLFRTKRFSSELKRWSRGIMEMRLRLYFEEFGPLVVPNPPVEEQREIANRVLEIESQVDLAVSKVRQEIGLLAELKTNLVSEVVTGQLKI